MHRSMLRARQWLGLRCSQKQIQGAGHEGLVEQPVSVDGDRGRVPQRGIGIAPDKPSKQQVVVRLFLRLNRSLRLRHTLGVNAMITCSIRASDSGSRGDADREQRAGSLLLAAHALSDEENILPRLACFFSSLLYTAIETLRQELRRFAGSNLTQPINTLQLTTMTERPADSHIIILVIRPIGDHDNKSCPGPASRRGWILSRWPCLSTISPRHSRF